MKVKIRRVDLSSKSCHKVEKANERHRVRQVKNKDLRIEEFMVMLKVEGKVRLCSRQDQAR